MEGLAWGLRVEWDGVREGMFRTEFLDVSASGVVNVFCVVEALFHEESGCRSYFL